MRGLVVVMLTRWGGVVVVVAGAPKRGGPKSSREECEVIFGLMSVTIASLRNSLCAVERALVKRSDYLGS